MTLPQLFLIYLIAVNLLAFLLFGIDKRRAIQGRWRIPERTLLLSSLLGGSLGGLAGMYLFHHKTRKPKFFISLPVFLIVHLYLIWRLFIR